MAYPIVPPDNTGYTVAAAIAASQSFTGNITAHAGGGQAAATPLTTTYNVVTTVATAGDSVALPLCAALGQEVVLISQVATSMQVFGSGTDTINGTATGTGLPFTGSLVGKTGRYTCVKVAPAGNWVAVPPT